VCVCKNPPGRGRVFCRLPPVIPKHDCVPPDEANDPVAIPITGELDLHTFKPAEVTHLLDDYFSECRRRGLRRVRVIHGKGTGTLRATVQAHLRRSPGVAGFATGDETSGGWGATIVTLKPADSC
jgi:DNA-nicking Smr family endonuclease